MSDITAIWRSRLARLERVVGPVDLSGGPVEGTGQGDHSSAPLLGITSSRLGRDPHFHYRVCQFLRRSVDDASRRGAELLVGSGSAIEPWAERAAELFGVTCRKLALSATEKTSELVVASRAATPLCIDAAVIALADRIDAVYVRRGGTISQCLHRRLQVERDVSVRVAIMEHKNCAAFELMQAGAIGWMGMKIGSERDPHSTSHLANTRVCFDNEPREFWGRSTGQWLIHCTRGRVGRWPGETERQYRDAMLLGSPGCRNRGSLDALLRILRSGRIAAGASVSSHRYPVVCFSSLSLQELMARRCYRAHLGRWDYEPYGLAIRLSAARELGVVPVMYGEKCDLANLPEGEKFRFHPRGVTYDWSREKEWRSRQSIELSSIESGDLRVFALDSCAARTSLRNCRWPVAFLSTAVSDRG